jgi:hypothetical protein
MILSDLDTVLRLLFAFAGFGEGVVEVLQKCGLVGEQLLSDFDFDVSLAGAFV